MVQAAARGGPRGHPRRGLQPHRRRGHRRPAHEPARHRQPLATTASTTTASTSTSPAAATPSNTSTDAAARLVLDSLRYWANDVQIDGFRFDLAATLGRDADAHFTPEHPLLRAIVDGPRARRASRRSPSRGTSGMGGWQTGNFGDGWHEWNDRYRDRVRNFWLSDVDYARRASTAPVGHRRLRDAPGGLVEHLQRRARPARERQLRHRARRLHAARPRVLRRQAQRRQRRAEPRRRRHEPLVQPRRRGPDRPTRASCATRRKAMRNLLGTLLLSAGVPDDHGR